MIAPTLLVGLGGTGSKIVSRVSKMVTEEQRKHIGFAVFDTDINELREIREANPYINCLHAFPVHRCIRYHHPHSYMYLVPGKWYFEQQVADRRSRTGKSDFKTCIRYSNSCR